MAAAVASRLAPPPVLTVSEWADRFRQLSREASAEPGQWRTDRAPYQKGMMDAVSDPAIETVVIMTSSQVGKTELELNTIGFFGHQDPAPVMAILPTIGEAEQWSKTRLAPMIRDTPVLRALFADPSSRNSGNTLLVKEYPGGHITIVGANAPSGLAAKPIRVVLGDEIDRFPASAGTEGDPITLAKRRTTTFWNRKLVWVSTPTLKGASRIEEAFLEGDQRRYYVPCPDCQTMQVLTWKGLRWEEGQPDSAAYLCPHCGVLIPESRKGRMLAAGEWRAGATPAVPRTASFHIHALYSPWARWADLVQEWLDCQGNVTRLQVFVNTILGETWEERTGGLDHETLRGRRETYAAEVPAGVGVLTMGVDVQADRLEYVIRGWGAGEESWLVAHGLAAGDPTIKFGQAGSPWDVLEAERTRPRRREDGATLTPLVTMVDSGHNAGEVYDYTGPRARWRVYATKGYSLPGKPIVGRRPTRNNKGRVPLWMIGTDAAKDTLYGRLKLATPGPLYMHIPDWTDDAWFEQVTAEVPERKQVAGGRWVRVYTLPRGARNEALDCEVLCLAALRVAPIRLSDLGKLAGKPREAGESPAEPPTNPPELAEFPVEPPRPRRGLPRTRKGWVRQW